MLISLVDALRCTNAHADTWLVASIDSLVDRDIREIVRETKAGREDLTRLEQTIDVLRRKQEAVSIDLRERMGGGAEHAPPEPQIPDGARLQARIAEIGGVRLNLGCGEKPLPGYVNVDLRALPDVDVVADIRRLPYGPGEVDEISSEHLVEHFRQHQLETVILPYWHSLLREGGALKVVCPNSEAMLKRVNSGDMTFAEFRTVTFGLQDYEGDDHFAMYSPDSLAEVIRRAGFEDVEVVAAERRNGLSTEMELVAVKPGPAANGGPAGPHSARDALAKAQST